MASMFHRRFVKKGSTRRHRLPFERRLLFSVLATGLPAVFLGLILLWTYPHSLDHKIEGTTLVLLWWTGLSLATRNSVVRSIQVLSNVLGSIKEDDFSLRAPQPVPGDALGDLAIEINNLARALENERLGTMEAETLLNKVIAEVDGAIFAFSPDQRVRLFNRAASKFLGREGGNLLGQTAWELGIEGLLAGQATETISRFLNGIEQRWIVRRTDFRQNGVPHRLIMLSEASEALRAEERLAWQRLVRVLGHEINNSLAPIKSMARTLARITENAPLPESIHENVKLGLDVISTRAEALNRFLQSYAKLTKLPPPVRRGVSMRQLAERVASLESRLPIYLTSAPDLMVNVDPDQIEQTLINLTRNAVEAVLMRPEADSPAAAVTVEWMAAGNDLELWVRDRGIGLLDVSNLFVPFYTTKEAGTGIGLLLSRQIVEAHGGRLIIRNRPDGPGCEVEVKIPGAVAGKAKSPPTRSADAV